MLTAWGEVVIELNCRTGCGRQDMDRGVTLTLLTANLSAVEKK